MTKDIVISEALEPARIAAELIPQYHAHLIDARILYLFTTQQRKKCDRARLASAQKFSDLQRYLSSLHFADGREASIFTGADFLMLVGRVEWEDLTTAQRRALVDHELSHMGRVEKITDTGVEGRWAILGHDLEEFAAVIQRHGLWRQEARDMAQVMQQLSLNLDHLAPGDAPVTASIEAFEQATAAITSERREG
jgi:hypothetical protein